MKATLFALCLASLPLMAQKQATNWYFGLFAGFAFTAPGNGPQPVSDSQLELFGTNAVISDAQTGQLLFYTNGSQVLNSLHQVMPNGDNLPDKDLGYDRGQSAIIVPVPAQIRNYYLFTLSSSLDITYKINPRYSIVDMNADSQKGDLIAAQKNQFLSSGLAEKITAIPHTNGRDYWLLTHLWKSDAFLVYPIHIGSIHQLLPGEGGANGGGGQLKASPDGRKLACAVLNNLPCPFDLFDFDASTGKLSNYVNLGDLRIQYGVSFSPDNSKLYVSNMTRVGNTLYPEFIRQYDLSAGDRQAIVESGESIIYANPTTNIFQGSSNPSIGFRSASLQLGPDGRLYGAANLSSLDCQCEHSFMVINKPNLAGYACDVQLKRFDFGQGQVGTNTELPNFIQSLFNGLLASESDPADNCSGLVNQIIVSPNPFQTKLEIHIESSCFAPYRFHLLSIKWSAPG